MKRITGPRPAPRVIRGLLILALGLTACGKKEAPPPATAGTPTSAATSASATPGASTPTAAKGAAATPAAPKATPTPGVLAVSLPVRPREPRRAWAISGLKQEPTGITFQLHFAPGEFPAGGPSPILLCVPPDEALSIKVAAPTLDGGTAPDLAVLTPAVTVERIGVLRRWALAAVRFDSRVLDQLRKNALGEFGGLGMELSVAWTNAVNPPAAAPHPDELAEGSTIAHAARTLVSNPEGLGIHQMDLPPADAEITAAPAGPGSPAMPAAGPWARLRLKEEGLHRVAGASLAALGWKAAGVKAYLEGKPVPTIVSGEDVLLWNAPNDSPFTAEHVYWLTFADGAEGPRIAEAEAIPADAPHTPLVTRRAMLDRDGDLAISYGAFRSIRAMKWCDAALSDTDPVSFELDLGEPGAPEARADVRLEFFFELGENAPPDLSVEGVSIQAESNVLAIAQRLTFSGLAQTTQTMKVAVPADGKLRLTLKLAAPLPVGVQNLWFDRMVVDYPGSVHPVAGRATVWPETANKSRWIPFKDVEVAAAKGLIAVALGEGDAPRRARITERKGHAGVEWRGDDQRIELYEAQAIPAAPPLEPVAPETFADGADGCDYLIIAHHDFIDGIQALKAWHEAKGRSVRVVDVQSVYDRFSAGEFSPLAIRRMLAWTLAHWRRAPEFVLLVGDCSSDFRDVARKGVRNFVPSNLVEGSGDEFASDDTFGMVAGNDLIADFLIGRISVNNVKDLAAVTSKTLQYADAYPAGPWDSEVGLAADNEPDFPATLDAIVAASVPPQAGLRRVYESEFPLEDNIYAADAMRRETFEKEGRWLKTCPAATSELERVFKSGSAVLAYLGHGSPNIWSTERVWLGGESQSSDNIRLRGSGRMTFVTNFTCNSGAIDYLLPPWNVNIIEDMVRTENGGAIGAWVPSGPGRTHVQEILGREFFKGLFDEGLRGIGEIALVTKTRFGAIAYPANQYENYIHYFQPDYLRMYILLGDPALELSLARRSFTIDAPQAVAGQQIEFTLTGLEPASGRAAAEITGEKGEPLAIGDAVDYTSGTLRLTLTVPSGAANLRVAGWNTAARDEFMAAGRITAPPVPAREEIAGASGAPTIKAESLRTAPESPSEGQTIYVRCALENKGTTPTAAVEVGLYDGDPAQGGKLAYNGNLSEVSLPNRVKVGSIPPGGSREVTLRWDPSFNAGEQGYWVRIEPAQTGGAGEQAAGKVRVRTKAKIERRNIRLDGNEQDMKEGRGVLRAEIVNTGETDARNISAAFYKGRKPSEENKIWETLVDVVPAKKAVLIEHPWSFGDAKALLDEQGQPIGFSVQTWIKGSKLRTASVADSPSPSKAPAPPPAAAPPAAAKGKP